MFHFYPKWACRGGDYGHASFWKYGLHDRVMISIVYLLERTTQLKNHSYSLRRVWNIPSDYFIFVDSGGYTLLQRGKTFLPEITQYLHFVRKSDINAYVTTDLPITPQLSIEKRVEHQLMTLKSAELFLKYKIIKKELYGVTFGWNASSIKNMTHALLKLENDEHFNGFAIGSLIPFSKDYIKLIELISTVSRIIRNRPIHAFGIGHIEGLYLCAALGVNSVDSTRYIIAGEFREYLLPQTGTPVYLGAYYKKKNRRKIIDLPCFCPVCKTSSIAELAKGGAENAAKVALHNLYIQISEERLIRSALKEGWFETLLKQKAKLYRRLNNVLPYLLRLKLYERITL